MAARPERDSLQRLLDESCGGPGIRPISRPTVRIELDEPMRTRSSPSFLFHARLHVHGGWLIRALIVSRSSVLTSARRLITPLRFNPRSACQTGPTRTETDNLPRTAQLPRAPQITTWLSLRPGAQLPCAISCSPCSTHSSHHRQL
jgi:hypothetical protein